MSADKISDMERLDWLQATLLTQEQMETILFGPNVREAIDIYMLREKQAIEHERKESES